MDNCLLNPSMNVFNFVRTFVIISCTLNVPGRKKFGIDMCVPEVSELTFSDFCFQYSV